MDIGVREFSRPITGGRARRRAARVVAAVLLCAAASIGTGGAAQTQTLPVLRVADASATESDGTLDFTVTLSATAATAVSVDYATAASSGSRSARMAAGCATAGADFRDTSGTLTIDAGDTSGTVSVPICGDALDEEDETFTLSLSNPSGATVSGGTATGTITDDDEAPTLSVGDKTVDEDAGTIVFAVELSAESAKTVTVRYATADGTATAPADYTAAPRNATLTFVSGCGGHDDQRGDP